MKYKQLSIQHLQWLLFSLAIVLATHSNNLPIWVTVACAGLGTWRYYMSKKRWAMPNIWLLVPITIVMCLGVALSFNGNFGRDASLCLLMLMCAMKLLETKTLRDYMLVIVLAYFLVGSLFLFNQNIATFMLSLLPLMALTATLIQISLNQPYHALFVFKLAGKMLLQALPLMLILFVLFPRIPGPLWGIPRDANSGMTGLGDSLELGNISNLTKNSSVAFRVQFKGNIPPANQLYWRGPVLWLQNKNLWLMNSSAALKQEVLKVQGDATDYTITLEPHNRLWLLLLDMPNRVPSEAKLSHDYSAVANQPVRSRIRYSATSYHQYQLSPTLNALERKMALQIRADENPKTIALAKSWSHLKQEQIIQQALNLFHQNNFIYTLRPPILQEHVIDQFLFTTQKGFCEHYASSFVYLMRAAGVPARIVTGYQGGELNPNGRYLIVRQSDAHAWAEVWLADKGWVRIDPTAAVSPERIEQGISDAISETDELPLVVRREYPWIKKAYLGWDSLNNGWNQWILGYDNQKQLDFLKKLSGKDLNMGDIIIWMIAATLFVILITAGIVLRKSTRKLNPTQQLYQRYLKQLNTIGLQPHTGEGALDFAKRVAQALPAQETLIMQIATHYNAMLYSKQPTANAIETLKTLILEFNIKKP
ncbi:MAG TPA: DUF3488 domain-containing protein [Methylophilaceae bacterium]|nr:DUF3488 domain-containing protein [Methylophilaceae bacterium]